MRDNHCTWCNQSGHRASHCPRRRCALPWPWPVGDLVVAAVLVALIAGWFQ